LDGRSGASGSWPIRSSTATGARPGFEPYTRSFWTEADLPGVGADYGLAFHGEAYVRRRWSEVFEIVDVRVRGIAGWQDLVVCRK
jgi:hypothetical protein